MIPQEPVSKVRFAVRQPNIPASSEKAFRTVLTTGQQGDETKVYPGVRSVCLFLDGLFIDHLN